MVNEKKTDLFISRLLDKANINYCPNGSDIKEVHESLKTCSKKKTGNHGFPEFVGISNDFILVIENKAKTEQQALYEDNENQILSASVKSCINYAENGVLHYAKNIVEKTNFKKVFAFGCSGDEKHHIIKPIFVDESGYKVLKKVENFKNFSEDSIEKYYKEQVLGMEPQEVSDLKFLLEKAKELNEDLRNYGQLGDSEKPLVVSAILLALSEEKRENGSFSIQSLTGDSVKTDGEKIFDAISTYMNQVKVEPDSKKDVILNQFNIIKQRVILNKVDKRLDKNKKLGKTPLKYFTEKIKEHLLAPVLANSPEDILGRLYGEFISYSGGDGQSLGVVLTPKHITELFCELIDIKPKDIVFDPCCGTGGFLVAAMHHMLKKAKSNNEKTKIKEERLHGIEIREDMFSVASTNMILRGDGKSNLSREDFLAQKVKDLRKKKYTVGYMNPPYSQAKNKDTEHLSELCFIKHLLDSLADNGKCVVIVPQSTMVGKTNNDKKVKKEILKSHTLEGVITLNSNTFYGVGTNACLAIFTAYNSHPKGKFCKFINFQDDGYEVKKNVGLFETERAKSQKIELLECWLNDKQAESKFMVKSTVEADDEWLHSFYYFNDEIPKAKDFEKTVAEYLTFEFSMIAKGRGYLFKEDSNDVLE